MEKINRPKKDDAAGCQTRAIAMLKAMAVAYGITCIVFIAVGILLTYTDITEDTVPLVSLVCTAIACAVAGFDWAKFASSRGILWGVLAGAVYGIILFLLEAFAGNGFGFNTAKLTMFLVALAGGGIGGILGINMKK